MKSEIGPIKICRRQHICTLENYALVLNGKFPSDRKLKILGAKIKAKGIKKSQIMNWVVKFNSSNFDP
jgi:hypothetical protein